MISERPHRARRVGYAVLFLSTFACAAARGQGAPNPRAVQPERPTVATHAYAVAPGFAELEAGWEWDRPSGGGNALIVPVLLKVGVAPRLQLGLLTSLLKPDGVGAGVGDASIIGKLQVTDGAPLVANAAVLVAVKFPTAAGSRGTGTTDLSLFLVSSRQLGPVSLDLNLGYTRRSGDGTGAPRTATLATAAAGWPVSGALGFTAEVYAYPGTSGPAGSAPVIALLGGPTYRVNAELVLDAGTIVKLAGPQPFALYAGLTWNLGRLARPFR